MAERGSAYQIALHSFEVARGLSVAMKWDLK
jgi:hypothetical protein